MVNLEGFNHKYTVFKNEDLKKLPLTIQTQIQLAGDMIVHNRVGEGKPENIYLVINTDESYADEVVAILEKNGHWDGMPSEESTLKIQKTEIQEAADLHLQTILELQRIQSIAYSVDDPVTRSIGVALSELEAKFHKIHDKWSEDD